MKDYILIFIMVFILGIFLFALISTNIWGMIISFSLAISAIIATFLRHSFRIEELEKKVEELMKDKEN